MPVATVEDLQLNYTDQGSGEPLLLIPYLSADSACYAFQLESHSERYRCLCIDLPGTGESSKPPGPYSTEQYADQVAAFLDAVDVPRAHVAGVSLGGAVAMQLAGRHPEKVASLGLHSTWDAPDDFLTTVVRLWRTVAEHTATVAEAVIDAIFPFCFTPELYRDHPDVVQSLSQFVLGRPPQPLAAFLSQTDAVLQHHASDLLATIEAPTLVTVGAQDLVCSRRFADRMSEAIPQAELVVFDSLSHAGLHEDPDTFNAASLEFLGRQHV